MDRDAEKDDAAEEGIEIPLDRFQPEILRKMVEEFVTRDWSELSDADQSLDEKIAQVLLRLQEKKAKVVYNLTTETCNIVSV